MYGFHVDDTPQYLSSLDDSQQISKNQHIFPLIHHGPTMFIYVRRPTPGEIEDIGIPINLNYTFTRYSIQNSIGGRRCNKCVIYTEENIHRPRFFKIFVGTRIGPYDLLVSFFLCKLGGVKSGSIISSSFCIAHSTTGCTRKLFGHQYINFTSVLCTNGSTNYHKLISVRSRSGYTCLIGKYKRTNVQGVSNAWLDPIAIHGN